MIVLQIFLNSAYQKSDKIAIPLLQRPTFLVAQAQGILLHSLLCYGGQVMESAWGPPAPRLQRVNIATIQKLVRRKAIPPVGRRGKIGGSKEPESSKPSAEGRKGT